MRVVHYFDYKSPYAYLAQEETFRLSTELGAEVDWLPYTLDIPSFLGAAEIDRSGRDVVGTRSAHQWRRVRYIYMDCRREANRMGMIIRGPRKIFDSSIAHIGFLYARSEGDFRRYHDSVFERFWKRELNIEDPKAVGELLEKSGLDASGFPDYLVGEGRREHDRIRADAEARGVFGVPSYLVGDELFWGGERLERVRELLRGGAFPRKRPPRGTS
jgi:2-hydroxychromene-2-carboxylate isomerase